MGNTTWRRASNGEQIHAEHWQSPMLLEDAGRLKGSDYFSPDPDHRFELQLHEHESMKHGDPEKDRAISSVLENVDVVVGRKFGPCLATIFVNGTGR